MSRIETTDVVIIGAGPSGAIAAALLRQQGRAVLVLERETFPRFSIGESLLPQSMAYIEEAGLLQDVVEAGFQYKNGATFARGATETTYFDFREKWTPGWGTTYQVQRGTFDKVLADGAARTGAEFRYQQTVLAADVNGEQPALTVKDNASGEQYRVEARFVLDASGFGRVLPRLLDLETPSNFPVRGALFTHIEDRTAPGSFDRNKIIITTHPQHEAVWYWTIPFSNGRCSQGVVAEPAFLAQYQGDELTRLQTLVHEAPNLKALLADAVWDTPVRQITGYAANVKSLYGKKLCLAGECGRVSRSGIFIRRDHRHDLIQPGRQSAGPHAGWRNRGLGSRLRRTAQARRGCLPRLCDRLVRWPLSETDLLQRQERGNPSHDRQHSGWLRLGRKQPVRARAGALAGSP